MNDASSSHDLALTYGVFLNALLPLACARSTALLAVILVARALRPVRRARLAHLAVVVASRSPSWSSGALRRSNRCSDVHADSTCASSNATPGLPPRLCCVLGVSRALDAFFRNCLPALFRAGAVHGLPSLRRLLPARSPASLSALGVLRVVIALARDRLRGFQHRSDACRCFVGLALTTLAPPLVVVSPSRYRTLPFSLRASASLLSWASLGHPRLARPPSMPCSWLPTRRITVGSPAILGPLIVLFRVSENLSGRLGLRFASLRGVLADFRFPPRSGWAVSAPRGASHDQPALRPSTVPALDPGLRPSREIGRAHV